MRVFAHIVAALGYITASVGMYVFITTTGINLILPAIISGEGITPQDLLLDLGTFTAPISVIVSGMIVVIFGILGTRGEESHPAAPEPQEQKYDPTPLKGLARPRP